MKSILKTEAARYTVIGGIIGCCFPLLGTILEANKLEGAWEFSHLISTQQQTPLLWIIDTAPVFLGLSAYFIGSRIDALRGKNRQILETQEQLILQNQMATIGKMTAGIAHEIKNPLNFVSNFAEASVEIAQELLVSVENLRGKCTKQEVDHLLEIGEDLLQNATDIQTNGDRAIRIVFSLMDQSRSNKGADQAVDINALIDKNINLAFHGYRANHHDFNLNIQKFYEADLPLLWLDGNSLGRVLLNLLDNACYALYRKQKTDNSDFLPILTVSTRAENEALEICIADNGEGIPKKIGDKIFEPFFTTKPIGEGNTGLGLSLSKEIIEQKCNGNLRYESQEGQFTSFFINLPINPIRTV